MRFYSYRTYKSVVLEIQELKRERGETLAMFVGRIERLCRDYRKVSPHCTEAMERAKVYDTFVLKVGTARLMEKLASEGATGECITTVLRVSQNYFDTFELSPWSSKSIAKEMAGSNPIQKM